MPIDSVRGGIRSWIEAHANKLGNNVLEIGSRIHDPEAWYLNNRDLAKGDWAGLDMQPGDGVDIVADITSNEDMMRVFDVYGSFSGILCSEVLEHCARPWRAFNYFNFLLKPGGWIVLTVPFGFHRHAYPNDYWRMTDQGLKVLCEDAGFVDFDFIYHGSNVISLKNHDELVFRKILETQLFAIARKPE